ncbi:MAG: sigma-54-dependent Fis family transcriptional regulator [Candidatus Saganbacteria bacterium]|nr:sigma-54-dependent Fis family transcriptional regulator [Candidatus Saganbacteria bacterium]
MKETKPTILVVDDESSVQESFSIILAADYRVLTVGTGEAALRKASEEKIDLVFLDIRMPGMDGMQTLSRLKKISSDLQIIMVTAVFDVQKAAEAIKQGARDYVVKPFDVEAIVALVKEVILKKSLLQSAGFRGEDSPLLVGGGEKIVEIKTMISEIAPKESWVLIVAEAGLEKEKVARMLHFQKLNSNYGFKSVDANNITERDIMEAQTLFIDNIERLSASFQQKLSAIGKGIKIIGGTSIDLKTSGFDSSLYKKLSENILSLPPVRDRLGDLVDLLQYYRNYYNDLYKKKTSLFSDEAMDILSLYSWPGNIEEIKSVISTAVLNQKEGEIEIESLPLYVLQSSGNLKSLSFEDIYSDFESGIIATVMQKNDSNKEKSAALLGVKPHVLESKLLR